MKDTDQSFERAMRMLETQLDTPKFLFVYWKAMDVPAKDMPWPEVCKPWWIDLEHLL